MLDLIGGARPSIADPFLPAKLCAGRMDDIRECIGCNICVSLENLGAEVRCTQNPTICEEWRRGWHPEKVPAARTQDHTLIVGGGPAGLEAALVLARAGHQVTVAEAREELGGRVVREARLRGLSAWGRVADYRLYQLRQMGNVDLYTGSLLDADAIAGFSRLVGEDEEGVLAVQRKHREELIDPLIARHGGRLANTAGDSLLIEFPSAVEAARCAVAMQTGMLAGTTASARTAASSSASE